jgi:SpoIIAA-like
MLRRIEDMPAGTLGFEAVGEVEDDDWEEAVEPVLRREIATGAKVRLLYLLGAEARDVDSDAVRAGTGFQARHAKAFERVAVVSDESWVKPAVRALSFLLPGQARAFPVHDLAGAKQWLAEPGDPGS